MSEPETSLNSVLEQIRERVEQQHRDGTYPTDLDEQLAVHLETFKAARVGTPLDAIERIAERVEEVQALAHLESRPVPTKSRIPFGNMVHRITRRLGARHLDELRRQHGEYATGVALALDEIVRFERRVARTIEDLAEALAENQRLLDTHIATHGAIEQPRDER